MNTSLPTTNDISVAKKFAKNFGLSLLEKIPGIGDLISAGVSAYIEAKDEKKMDEMLDLIGQQISQLSKDKIDQTYLKSSEFAELIIQVLKQARDNAAEEKAFFYAQAAAESILIDRTQIESVWRNEFLKKISEVNVEEFLFLKAAASSCSTLKAVTVKSHIFDSFKDKKLCISSLLSKGLIEDASVQNVADHLNPGQQRALKTEGLIKLTELGYRITDYILSLQSNLKKHSQSV